MSDGVVHLSELCVRGRTVGVDVAGCLGSGRRGVRRGVRVGRRSLRLCARSLKQEDRRDRLRRKWALLWVPGASEQCLRGRGLWGRGNVRRGRAGRHLRRLMLWGGPPIHVSHKICDQGAGAKAWASQKS